MTAAPAKTARTLDQIPAPAALKQTSLNTDTAVVMVGVYKWFGEFHVLLADAALNPYVSKYMHELCSLTCLVIALYDAPGTPACPHHEHAAIVDALEARAADAACALMVEHLDHVENTLRLEMPADAEVDFQALFA